MCLFRTAGGPLSSHNYRAVLNRFKLLLKEKRNFTMLLHYALIFLGFCFVLAGCMPSSTNQRTTHAPAIGTTTGGFSPTPNTNTSNTNQTQTQTAPKTTGQIVYIFKYTGRKFGQSEHTSSSLMEGQLRSHGIQHQEKLTKFKDGKTYEKTSGAETGDIVVFAIDSGSLALSEHAGFCSCTLQRDSQVCTPHPYAADTSRTEPAPSCR